MNLYKTLMILFCFGAIGCSPLQTAKKNTLPESSNNSTPQKTLNHSPEETSNLVLTYEKKLQELEDSISHIQQQLITVIEDPSNAFLTRDKAVYVLASIHREEVLTYLLENEKDLHFGAIDPDNDDDFDNELYRTAMIAIYKEYLMEPKLNWMVFPFLMKYVEKVGASEIGLLRRMYGYGNQPYQDTWYLMKFMQSNMTPAIKKMIESELRVVKEPE